MSFFVMRPLSPLPFTFVKSIPLSAANFFASGDALMRWSEDVCVFVSVAGSTVATATVSADPVVTAAAGVAELAPDFSAAM